MNAVIQFPTARIRTKPKEVRVADLDDGYTRIANELYEALIGADLTKHQLKVVLAVIRKTYGFNQTHDRISNGQLAEMTGLPETRVSTAKNQLLEMGVLVSKGRMIGPNKVLSEWKTDVPQNRESFPETGCKSFPETGKEASPKQGNTKDTIQKTRKTKSKNTSAEPVVADSTPVVVDSVTSPPTVSQTPSALPVISDESVAIELTLNTGAQYPVTETFANQMQALYPAVNVAQELRAMCGWLLANPTKRKTKAGINRFINSWLAKCQDRGGQNGLAGYAPRGGHTDLTQSMTADELNRRIREGF